MSPVRTEAICPVLLITIDHPPINATSHAVRAGLVSAIDELSRRPDLAAAVLIGPGSTFIAGADIREFGQPAMDPSLPGVIEAIEACPKPVVAALPRPVARGSRRHVNNRPFETSHLPPAHLPSRQTNQNLETTWTRNC